MYGYCPPKGAVNHLNTDYYSIQLRTLVVYLQIIGTKTMTKKNSHKLFKNSKCKKQYLLHAANLIIIIANSLDAKNTTNKLDRYHDQWEKNENHLSEAERCGLIIGRFIRKHEIVICTIYLSIIAYILSKTENVFDKIYSGIIILCLVSAIIINPFRSKGCNNSKHNDTFPYQKDTTTAKPFKLNSWLEGIINFTTVFTLSLCFSSPIYKLMNSLCEKLNDPALACELQILIFIPSLLIFLLFLDSLGIYNFLKGVYSAYDLSIQNNNQKLFYKYAVNVMYIMAIVAQAHLNIQHLDQIYPLVELDSALVSIIAINQIVIPTFTIFFTMKERH